MTKAYISATFEDLKECRQAVRNALDQIGIGYRTWDFDVVKGRDPSDRGFDDIDSCDIYIGIFAWRYGYVPLGQTKSVTHLEYEHAVAAGKHCLIFLLDEKATWPVMHVDRGPSAQQVDELRRTLSTSHLCRFFTSPDRLALQVVAAVASYLTNGTDGAVVKPAHDRLARPGMSAPTRQHYFERLAQQYGSVKLGDLIQQQQAGSRGVPLAEVFVEPLVREAQPAEMPDEAWRRLGAGGQPAERDLPDSLDVAELAQTFADYHRKPAVPVLDALCSLGKRAFVLLGHPGLGKSTIVRFLALALTGRLADKRVTELGPALPIVVELRGYASFVADGGSGFLDYLVHRADVDGYRTEPRGLENHLVHGDRAVVMFDGLDEISDRDLRVHTAERIAAFAAEFPNARVVVTSRLPGYPRGVLTTAAFAHHTLQDLSADRVADFLGRWFRYVMPGRRADATRQRDVVVRAIRQSRELSELAGNPMLLTILALVGERRGLPQQRWNLYDSAAAALLERWDTERLPSLSDHGTAFVDADDKRELFRRVAFEMQSGQSGLAGNYLHSERLKQLFADYLADRYNLDKQAANKAAVSLIGQLRERDLFLAPYGPQVWGFAHRTFLEFFCAGAILRQFQHSQRLTFADIKGIYRERWADPSWHEVLRLIAGRLPGHQTAEIATLLITEANQGYPGTGAAAEPWNIALAVQCIAGMRPPSAAGPVAELVLRHVERLIEYCAVAHDPAAVELIGNEILPAIDSVGPHWPGRAGYLSWYQRQAGSLLAAPAAIAAARTAAMLASPEDGVEEVFAATATSPNDIRLVCAAVTGLAEVIRQGPRRDPAPDTTFTRQRLVDLAATDGRVAVRAAAAQALGTLSDAGADLRDVLSERAVTDPSPEVRLSAVEALVQVFSEDPAVTAALLGGPRSDASAAVRRAVVRAFIAQGDRPSEVVRSLLDACRMDADAEVVEAAARALLTQGDTAERVQQALVHRLRADPSARVRRVAVRLLSPAAYEEEMIDRLTQDADRSVVREVARVVAGRRGAPVERLRAALIDRLRRDADDVMRAAIVKILCDFCGMSGAVDEALAETAVQDQIPSVRLAAVSALADHPARDQHRALFVKLVERDTNAPVRLAAVRALGMDQDVTATAALAAVATADPMLEVRIAAIRGLTGRSLDRSIGEQLVRLTYSGQHPQLRLAAVEVLQDTRPRGVDLDAMFRDRIDYDTVADVFAAAAAAAAVNGDNAAWLWEIVAARATSDANPRLRSAAVTLLGTAVGFDGALPVVSDRLRNDEDPATIGTAAAVAAAMNPSTARDLLMGRLTAPDPDVRSAVLHALRAWVGEDREVRAAVCAEARSAASPSVRRTAVEALASAIEFAEVRETLLHRVDDPDPVVREEAERLLQFAPVTGGSGQ